MRILTDDKMMKTSTKKLSLKLFGALLLLVFANPFTKAQTPVAQNGQLKVIGNKLCNQYGNPIQLRGMSSHGIQWYGWGKCLTEASLDAMAYDWGADIFRISMYVQEGGYESNPSGFTNQVSTLINEATERGMYALVDFHQLSPGDPNYNLENAKRFFTDIANTHKNKNNIIYDICNEPNGVAWSRIKTYADQIIPVIRAIDPDAVILIGTHGWGSLGISDGRTAQDIVSNPVNHSNIMYTFHFYAKSHQSRYLQELDWASDRLPIFVTEFGTQEASGDGPNDFTMSQRYIDLMRQKKISWINWNYSDDFRTGAVWQTGTCSNGPWTASRLKPAGQWIRERMLNPADDFQGGNNIPPTVSVASPGNNATFTAGQTVNITANASDEDGNIVSVEYFVDGNSIGSETSSPYTEAWVAAAGTHTITVKATDNKGASTTSTGVTVTVTNVVTQSPYGGTVRSIPGKIEAEHYDLGGQGVAFNDLSNGNSGSAFRTDNVDIEACTDLNSGYNVGWIQAGEWLEYTVNVTAEGSYKLNVRVAAITSGKTFHIEMDGLDISGTITVPNTGDWQNWQTVTVNTKNLTTGQKVMRIVMDATDFNINYVEFTTGTNQAPSVNITSPSNNTSVNLGTSVTIIANASDDGSVTKVEFFSGSQFLGTDISSPYSVNWTAAAAGSYSITAKATDNNGVSTTSAPITITVNGNQNTPPTVNITAPANNSSVNVGTSITISANASDNGSITLVEFYHGNTKIGSDASSPYSIVWSGAAAGTYTITAKATDNENTSTTSAPITITVKSTNSCSGTPNYVENGGYSAGSKVQNGGSIYECKPWPYSGWCNGSAWAYAPGTGLYWSDAWTLVGSCSSSRQGDMTGNAKVITTAPNPFNNEALISVEIEMAGETSLIIYDQLGQKVAILENGYLNAGTHTYTLDASKLTSGIYICKLITNEMVSSSVITKR